MKKVKFFTIDPAQSQTLTDGQPTHYEINTFLNSGIKPKDISAEYNELTGHILISVGYEEGVSDIKKLFQFIAGKPTYEVRFENLTDYRENMHTVYIQKALEDAINLNTHKTISHGIFVEKGTAKVVFLEEA